MLHRLCICDPPHFFLLLILLHPISSVQLLHLQRINQNQEDEDSDLDHRDGKGRKEDVDGDINLEESSDSDKRRAGGGGWGRGRAAPVGRLIFFGREERAPTMDPTEKNITRQPATGAPCGADRGAGCGAPPGGARAGR